MRQLESSPCSPQLEKARAQQQRPSTAINKSILKTAFCPVPYILYHHQENAGVILIIISQHLYMNQIIYLHTFIYQLHFSN